MVNFMGYLSLIAIGLASLFYYLYNRKKKEVQKLEFDIKEKDMEQESNEAKKLENASSEQFKKDSSEYDALRTASVELLRKLGIGSNPKSNGDEGTN